MDTKNFKKIVETFLLAFILASCTFTLEKSSGRIGAEIIDEQLIIGEVIDLRIDSGDVTDSRDLRGFVVIQNYSDKIESGDVSIEITTPGAFKPIWNAIITVDSLAAGDREIVDFVFYHDGLENSINFAEAEAERALNYGSEDNNKFNFDLIVRSQINDIRISFNYYRK